MLKKLHILYLYNSKYTLLVEWCSLSKVELENLYIMYIKQYCIYNISLVYIYIITAQKIVLNADKIIIKITIREILCSF